jgi:hypothetical protein
MASVLRVQDQRTGRECALKRLSAKIAADPLVAELFEREFHILSELAHPSIIEVYDYGIANGRAYYTMELLGGQDLRTLGRVPWRVACSLLRDLASSLANLHSRRLLHGDVSPRNVRCTLDGRAKLLDFGAMQRMGPAKRIVGTPPFIAPEMLQLQALDGRTDLYAFGGIAYLLLTGSLAYPANHIHQLNELWQNRLPAPIELDPEIPEALSELVTELLQLNRNARPRSAGNVMARICSIAGLPFEESDEVADAYLSTPTLVGRDVQLARARERLVSTLQGRGGVLIAAAPVGGGRSRFLDACVLEAKLLGLQVVRIDKADSEHGSYGAAKALCRQLFELAPQAARSAAQLHSALLAHFVGAELAGAEPAVTPPERAQSLAALRDFALGVARSMRLLIAVDDAEHIDEASASLLVALGQKAPRRTLCLALTIESDSPGSAALDILAPIAERIDLPALSEEQTEQLFRAMFGDAKNLFMLAGRMHGLAQGNLRATMQLARHLVEQGIARYEAGSFSLPEQLREQDLPLSLAAALELRVQRLDPDALELARVLALTDPGELSPAAYVELTSHGDRARTYRAVDQLLRAQVLEAQAERYRMSDPMWKAVLTSGLSAQERVAFHARLCRVFEHGGTLTLRSYHLMESDQAEAAIRLMLAQFIKDPNEPKDPLADYVPGLIDQIERASLAAEALRLPAPLRIELRMKLAGASQFLGDIPRFMRTAPATLQELERDSSLNEYNALDPTLEPLARLTEAFTRVQARYDATPAAERGLSPAEAIRELARCCVMFAGVAAISQDTQLLERVPSLAAFTPLSPAVAAIQEFIEFTRALMQARDDQAREAMLPFIARLEQPDGAGLGQLYNTSLRLGALYMLGLIDATEGIPEAGARMAALEAEPGHRLNALRVHMACHMMQGNFEAAEAAQRKAELVMLQDGQQQRYPGTTTRPELLAFWLSEDIAGLKLLNERLGSMVHAYPHWQLILCVSRCFYRQLQGDAAGALAALEPALAIAKPLKQRDWAWVAVAHVHVLVALGRAEDALEFGRKYMALSQEHKLAGYRRIANATVEALIANQLGQEAAQLTDQQLEYALEHGVRGLALGALYELRARAATLLGDQDSFYRYCQLCAAEYQPERNPALAARYQRLFRQAQRYDVSAAPSGAASLPADGMTTMLKSRLLSCHDAAARARCVLAVLVEQTDAKEAYLFSMRGGRPAFACALPEAAPPENLQSVVEDWLDAELKTILARSSKRPSSAAPAVDAKPCSESARTATRPTHLRAITLISRNAGQALIAGIAALHLTDGHPVPDPALVQTLSDALIDHDDVDPATCFM